MNVDLSHRSRVAGHCEIMAGWFRPLRPEESAKAAEMRAAGLLAPATHRMVDGKPTPIEPAATPVAAAPVAAPAAPATPAIEGTSMPARKFTTPEEVEREYNRVQAEWRREQSAALRDNSAVERWIAAGAPAPSENDLAAADMLISGLHGFKGESPGPKKLRETTAPTGPVDPHPTQNERQPQRSAPGDTPKPNPGTGEKGEPPDWFEEIIKRGNKKAPAKQPAKSAEAAELDAILAPGLADLRARRARGL